VARTSPQVDGMVDPDPSPHPVRVAIEIYAQTVGIIVLKGKPKLHKSLERQLYMGSLLNVALKIELD
jgi:hypothetical protein